MATKLFQTITRVSPLVGGKTATQFASVNMIAKPAVQNHARLFSNRKSSVIPSILQQNMSPVLLNQQNAMVQNKIKPKTDNTASVYLENPPLSTEEDKDAAAYLGVNNFYRGGNNHFYMIQFEPTTNPSIHDYVEAAKLQFYSKVPYGSISSVEISSQLLGNIQHLLQTSDIQCRALFFDKKRVPGDVQRVAELLFVIMTPGGFWNISCHSTYMYLTTNKDQLFGNILKNLHVELRKSAMKLEETKKAKKSSKLTKRKTITQKAPIGAINLIVPESNEELSGYVIEEDE